MTQELEIVSQVGGAITAVDVQSGYVYIAAGPRMQMYDVFEPTNPVLVSETEAYSAVVRDLEVAGAYVYLGHDGRVLRVLDVTNPFAPLERGSVILHSPYLDLGCFSDGHISQIDIQGSYAFVVVNVNCHSGGPSLHILDISDPLNPHEVSRYVVDENASHLTEFHISLVDHKVYVVHDWFLDILDVSDPANPTLLAEHDLGINDIINDMTIEGTYAYMVSRNRLYIFDIINSPSPMWVGHYAHQGEHIAVKGNHAYILDDGFYILDITNKIAPQLIGSNQVPQPQGIAISDGYVFVAADSLYVFPSINLPDPPEVASFPLDVPAYDVYVTNNMAYVETQNGLHILDVSQIDQPVLLGMTDICGYISELFVEGNIAYLGGSGSLCILDVSQPDAPQLLHIHEFVPVESNFSHMSAIAKRGNFLYLTLNEASCFPMGGCHSFINTIRILDVSNPAIPIEMPLYQSPSAGELSDLAIVDDNAYLSAGKYLRVLSLANPTVPVEVGSLTVPNHIHHITITGNRGYVDSYGNSPIIHIINLEDLTQPTLIGEVESFAFVRDMTAIDNSLYIIDRYNLQVIDTSSPTNPRVVGEYTTDNFINQFHLVEHNAFLATNLCYACNSGSMLILDTSQLMLLLPIAKAESVLQKAAEVIVHNGYIFLQNTHKVQILLSQEDTVPIKVGEYNTNGRIWQMVLEGDYLYLNLSFLDQPDEIHIVNIAQPTQPILVSHTSFGGQHMVVAGQYMYLTGSNGLAIWDVSDPSSPIEVSYYEPDDAYDTGFVTIIDSYVFMFVEGNDNSYRLNIVNVSDPATPVHVGDVPLTDWAVVDMELVNDIVYVVQPYSGLMALDVANPVAPQLLGTFSPWESLANNIEFIGQVVYVAEPEHGVQLLDISDPTQIQAMSLLELPYTVSIAATDDEIHVAAWQSGLITLRPFQESITSTATQFNSPSNDVTLQFDNNISGTIQYQRWWQDTAVGDLWGVGLHFEVTAVTTESHLLQSSPYTITVYYDQNDLGPILEETLALYRREDNQWLPETSSTLNMTQKTITASLEQTGQFAVLGETYRTYFPIMLHGHNKEGYRLRLTLDQNGDFFTDLSGYQHHGRCLASSCPESVPGINRMARHFDGLDDFIQLGNPQALNLSGKVTIAAWIKPETITGLQNIVAHGYATAPNGEVFLRIVNGYYEAGSWDGNNHYITYPVPADDIGQWTHLASVYDGTTWRLYRNGIEVGRVNENIGSVSVHGQWAIGANGAGTIRFFQGNIDEVMIYDRALSAIEIEAEYHQHQSGSE